MQVGLSSPPPPSCSELSLADFKLSKLNLKKGTSSQNRKRVVPVYDKPVCLASIALKSLERLIKGMFCGKSWHVPQKGPTLCGCWQCEESDTADTSCLWIRWEPAPSVIASRREICYHSENYAPKSTSTVFLKFFVFDVL